MSLERAPTTGCSRVDPRQNLGLVPADCVDSEAELGRKLGSALEAKHAAATQANKVADFWEANDALHGVTTPAQSAALWSCTVRSANVIEHPGSCHTTHRALTLIR